MKRIGHLLPNIADMDTIRYAYHLAKRGKEAKQEVMAFTKNLDRNLLRIHGQLERGSLDPIIYKSFEIFDPKPRTIYAAAFEQRVIQHAIMRVCDPVFERRQIFHNYACRRGKGTYAAIDAVYDRASRYTWYLKLDFRKYFDSIQHDFVKQQLSCIIKDPTVLNLFSHIIDSYTVAPYRGLPIGNLTSQYLANHYLNEMDHMVIRLPYSLFYARYMDDTVYLSTAKEDLLLVYDIVKSYAKATLGLALKPPILNRIEHGIPFLGYRIFYHDIRLSARSRQRFIKKYKYYTQMHLQGNWSDKEYQRRLSPLYSFASKASTTNLIRKWINIIEAPTV